MWIKEKVESCYQKQSEEYNGANDEKDFKHSQKFYAIGLLRFSGCWVSCDVLCLLGNQGAAKM